MNHRRENDAKSLLFPPRLQLRRNEPVWVALSGSLGDRGGLRQRVPSVAVNPQALAARGGGAPEDWNYISWRGYFWRGIYPGESQFPSRLLSGLVYLVFSLES